MSLHVLGTIKNCWTEAFDLIFYWIVYHCCDSRAFCLCFIIWAMSKWPICGKGIIPIVGSWIGGSSSMLVLKEYVAVREDLFLSVLLLDNMIQNIVMIFLFQIIRRTDEYNQKFNISQPISFSEKEQNQNRIQKKPLSISTYCGWFDRFGCGHGI